MPTSYCRELPMARNESDRDDLLREATALRPRVEWHVPGEPDTVMAGLKRDGGLSIYFGSDPVYQFTARGQLRRAFVDGDLFRTQGTTLARLQRVRDDSATTLRRTDLSAQELESFLNDMEHRLAGLLHAHQAEQVIVVGLVADGPLPDFSAILTAALAASPQLAPAFSTRRR